MNDIPQMRDIYKPFTYKQILSVTDLRVLPSRYPISHLEQSRNDLRMHLRDFVFLIICSYWNKPE